MFLQKVKLIFFVQGDLHVPGRGRSYAGHGFRAPDQEDFRADQTGQTGSFKFRHWSSILLGHKIFHPLKNARILNRSK